MKANHGDLKWPLLIRRGMLQKTKRSHLPQSYSGLKGSGINSTPCRAESVFSFSLLSPSSLQISGRDDTGLIPSLRLKSNSQWVQLGQELSLFWAWILHGIYDRWEFLFLSISGVIHNSKDRAIPKHTGISLVPSLGKDQYWACLNLRLSLSLSLCLQCTYTTYTLYPSSKETKLP